MTLQALRDLIRFIDASVAVYFFRVTLYICAVANQNAETVSAAKENGPLSRVEHNRSRFGHVASDERRAVPTTDRQSGNLDAVK